MGLLRRPATAGGGVHRRPAVAVLEAPVARAWVVEDLPLQLQERLVPACRRVISATSFQRARAPPEVEPHWWSGSRARARGY